MRHAWDKLETHHYRCTRCGMDKINAILPEPDARGWAQWETRFARDGETWTGATPPCTGALPAAPAPDLVWTRIDTYHERAETGEQVSAGKGVDGWKFFAWGADVAPEFKWYEWPPGDKYHYRRGEHVPQRCALLGVFKTADEARLACARDAARKKTEGRRAAETRPAITQRTETECIT
ncbi:MAG: hypothetical protein EOM91_17815 [Sphingobacteriia bacterium]|nr:hypothetical protein [Sphingobacteriia bacterium]NCC41354.1 hypothetical protein [Gammaproteobacteria bacterium]